MKIAAPSADLLIKLALGAAAIGLAIYAMRRVSGAVSEAAGAVGEAVSEAVTVATYASPATAIGSTVGRYVSDRDNVAYHTVNTIGGSLVTNPAGPGKNADGSWSLGGWIYDITH